MINPALLWSLSEEKLATHPLTAFRKKANQRYDLNLQNFDDLHAWSICDIENFWELVWDFCKIIGEKGGRNLISGEKMMDTAFFPDAQLNFAENLLRRNDDGDALIFRGEDQLHYKLSWAELHDLVSRMQQCFIAWGIQPGDRVAAMMPNMPETIAAMLAATSLGAIWSSCSPDFGEHSVLDRFSQIAPTILIACDGYYYNGKRIEIADKLTVITDNLPSLRHVVIIPYLNRANAVASSLTRGVALSEALANFEAKSLVFTQLPFSHPLYILFSSGTTGVPKCIVHSAGGTLLQHVKEQHIQYGIDATDRFFYFTTCGWMMWNWLVSGLASGATLVLFDGSPLAPDENSLFDYAEEEKITFFGTSAKYIDAVRKSGLRPGHTHDLSHLRMMTSTGSPLAPENFDFVYQFICSDIHLASISGGTDIVSCFVGGVASKPVLRGEIQGPGLGMACEVWNDDGQLIMGEKGELVCTKPFPCMPLMFWGDEDGTKYHNAYFSRFSDIWCHGDFAERTCSGGFIIYGRSDATLNPGGVRIGTAEIYNIVENMPEIMEALCIGQDWENDVRIVLFVRLTNDVTFNDTLITSIKTNIRKGASPRHVPAKIIAVSDIPRTKSGKITELAVRDIIHGREVKNSGALTNPWALDLYRNLEELQN